MKFCAVILANGTGTRFGEDELKQNIMLKDKPVWKWVYDTAQEHFEELVVVGKDVAGGDTRQESVKIGINAVHGDYVVIFDAVRPLVTHEQIEQIKEAVEEHFTVSFGIEPADTILDKGEYKRSGLVSLQVPQAFNLAMLRAAHEMTKMNNATDDTIIYAEHWGKPPKILEGGCNLHKITRPMDLQIIKSLCKK